MTQMLGKKAAQMIFAKHIASIEPQDPLYDEVTDESGRKKRVRRLEPEGLSKADLKILKKIKKRAHRMDKGMNLCGFRVGYTFFISLIPGVGDITDLLLGQLLIIKPAKKLELPPFLITQMYTNQAISTCFGIVPILGDVVLGVWKTNSRNAHLLEEYLALRGHVFLLQEGYESSQLNDIVAKNLDDKDLNEVYKPGHGRHSGEKIVPMSQGSGGAGGNGWFSLFTGRKKTSAAGGAAAAGGTVQGTVGGQQQQQVGTSSTIVQGAGNGASPQVPMKDTHMYGATTATTTQAQTQTSGVGNHGNGSGKVKAGSRY